MVSLYTSQLTKLTWEISPSENGLVAVCDQLRLVTEGKDFQDIVYTISECETILLDDLLKENIFLHDYIEKIRNEFVMLTHITK